MTSIQEIITEIFRAVECPYSLLTAVAQPDSNIGFSLLFSILLSIPPYPTPGKWKGQ